MTELTLQVLLALGDGPAHGYAIGKDIETRTGGRLDPATGALYQALRRLTDAALIRQVASPDAADARRKYFALTPQGRAAAGDELARLRGLVDLGRRRKLNRESSR